MLKMELINRKLNNEQIVKVITEHQGSPEVTKYLDNEAYFKGENPTISNMKKKEDSTYPDNRVPIPYGRKVSITTKNYMFGKPVNYTSDDKNYIGSFYEVFNLNAGDKKNTEIGLDLIIHGVGYKLFYAEEVDGKIFPRYVILEGNEIIPIYDYNIEPQLMAGVRYYKRNGSQDTNFEIYYAGAKTVGKIRDNKVIELADEVASFSQMPLVVYSGSYQVGIFDSVKKIIDAIDKIVSQNMNEIDRFELAYLVLTGQHIDQKTLDEIKQKRCFELDTDTKLSYLLKEINGDFNENVLIRLVAEVHKQSGVPDFSAPDFAAISSLALRYKLMGFENIASDIEAIFKEGEYKSFGLIDEILLRKKRSIIDMLLFWREKKQGIIDIEMTRNLPQDVKEKLDNALGMKNIGISQETIIDSVSSILPVDEEEELAREEAEKQAYVNLDTVQPPLNPDEMPSDKMIA